MQSCAGWRAALSRIVSPLLLLAGIVVAGLPCFPQSPHKFSVEVSAKSGWEDSGIEIREGEILNMEWESGRWRGDIGSTNCPMHGPAGPTCDAALAPSGYPLPGKLEDSLVGRIDGDPVFFIGQRIRKIATQSGNLHLRINDLDEGLNDNQGSITMEIWVTSP